MGQESGHGLPGSFIRGFIRLPSRHKSPFRCDHIWLKGFNERLQICVYKTMGLCHSLIGGTETAEGKSLGCWLLLVDRYSLARDESAHISTVVGMTFGQFQVVFLGAHG